MCCMRLAENTGRKNDAKNRHLGTIPQLCRPISSQLRHVSTIGKNLLSSNISSIGSRNMVNFGLLAAQIASGVWGTPATFNGFRVLAALLHGSQAVRRLRGAIIFLCCGLLWPPYVIGGPLYFCPVVSFFFLSSIFLFFPRLISAATDWMSTILLHMAWP